MVVVRTRMSRWILVEDSYGVVTILQEYECCVVETVGDDGAMSTMAKTKGAVAPLYVYFEALVHDHVVVAAAAAAGFAIVAQVTFVVAFVFGGAWSLTTTMRKRGQ